MTGAELAVQTFREWGVRRVFTYPGGTIAPLFAACERFGVEIVCARHEQGAGYMALAMARLSGRAQVVMVTSGPGVTNLATVVADAYFDSTPLVAITGQVGTGDLLSGRDVRQAGFQQVDTVGIMRPICKDVVVAGSKMGGVIDRAFRRSMDGRPGPVVVDMPMDVQRAEAEGGIYGLGCSGVPEVRQEVVEEVAGLLIRAERPIVFAGQGVLQSGSVEKLRGLVGRLRLPVVTSLLGLGAVKESLGYVGHTGSRVAGLAVHNEDLVLVLGARLDVRQTGTRTGEFVPKGRVVRVDLDRRELDGSRVDLDVMVHGDVEEFVGKLSRAFEGREGGNKSAWWKQIDKWKEEYPPDDGNSGGGLRAQNIIKMVSKLSKGRSVVVTTGVGSHQQWAARHFDFDYPERVWLTSGGHGAMGYDLPSAIGAQLERPDSLVVCFVGDGSLQINIQELQTVLDMDTPIKIFVLDNSRLGLVSQFQLQNWGSDPTTGHKTNPDFSAVARAYGIKAYRLDDPAEVESTIRAALEYDGAVLVHCCVDYNENVSPMLMAGKTMDDMWPRVGSA